MNPFYQVFFKGNGISISNGKNNSNTHNNINNNTYNNINNNADNCNTFNSNKKRQ
ncbi:hypothetical protein [Methanobrevibacter arboriphilus]|uniref:hypothetical protein n=1 Tax=Methanobrevibacter arboriphilus TaxID=39441 RepID=UPI001CDB3EBC|nr:hypothetical protein [Methanobrevibacter arboriphilus]